MKVPLRTHKAAGFSAVEALLLLVIVGAIAGIGVYVVRQKDNANNTLSSGSVTQNKAPAGTTGSIDQLTQQDAQTESGVDNSADATVQQNASSANGTVNNVGGAYNEASF